MEMYIKLRKMLLAITWFNTTLNTLNLNQIKALNWQMELNEILN